MLMPGKGKTVQARLWAYVVDDRAAGASTPALTWYRFTPDRSGIHPQSGLKDFTGLLQADAYAGFDKLYRSNRIQEVACWAHFRRKIFENHATSPTPLTSNLLDRIAALYRIEEELRGQPPDQRRRHRQDRSKPMSSRKSLATGPLLAGMSSCRGIGIRASKTSLKPHSGTQATLTINSGDELKDVAKRVDDGLGYAHRNHVPVRSGRVRRASAHAKGRRPSLFSTTPTGRWEHARRSRIGR
ncbi:hypothetical protein SBA_ch2_5860 [Sphingomonas bisphenolicum]|uniref:Transposase IS66 central domain-containing protein n=2 Tax=Sphingomonas bisphenolicum TaxID=296544 RepID=A0ABM7G824_9SPHN|nr:hypothetical protein SBA_ch2_5860 [Sphingomonas bisphenolicum]